MWRVSGVPVTTGILSIVSILLTWILPILSQDNTLRIIIFHHSNVFTRRTLMSAANRFGYRIRNADQGTYSLKEAYSIDIRESIIMEELNKYSPPEILDGLCEQLLEKRITTLVYISDITYSPQKTASAQYLLKMANFLGIPIIAWIGDNSGIVQVGKPSLLCGTVNANKANIFRYFGLYTLQP